MWIIDLTQSLTKFGAPNYYVFNPSMVAITDDLFLLTYRICRYDVADPLHPWKIWDNGYKYFAAPEKVKALKYRSSFGDAFTRPLRLEHALNEFCAAEYDSTGIATLRFMGDRFHVLSNQEAPFGTEMNQDARLGGAAGGKVRVSYNCFEKCADRTCVRMRYRELLLAGDAMHFSREQNMFEHKYKHVEKNCVFHGDDVIYEVGKKFSVIRGGTRRLYPSLLEPFIKYYGENVVHCSSSTPPIKYGRGYLACAHIKMVYKKIAKEPFKQFLDGVDFSLIKRHGKYVYFIVLYEFDADYNMTRISSPFIPSSFSNHLPYLLVMPTGLCYLKQNVAITYGEGDCRCKVLVLAPREIETLLAPRLQTMGCFFLTEKHRIDHLGYFGFSNTGDEAFIDVFKYLHAKYFPAAELAFVKKPRAAADLTILGGGDVINPYFTKGIDARRAIAAGVGIPYEEFERDVYKFGKVFLRNRRDARRLGIAYFPDLVFLLPKIFPEKIEKRARAIGISVMRTYYNAARPARYNSYIESMVSFVKILTAKKFSATLIPFGVASNKDRENDLIACEDIRARVGGARCAVFRPRLEALVRDVYTRVGEMEFMICGRFHSHIFTMLHGTPFLSLSFGRKSVEFMRDSALEGHVFPMEKDDLDLPLTIEPEKLYAFFAKKYRQRKQIAADVTSVRDKNVGEMENFEREYVKAVRNFSGRGQLVLYPEIETARISNSVDVEDAAPAPMYATQMVAAPAPADVVSSLL